MSGRYGIGSTHYLNRAKEQLQRNTPSSLFYAAFELRCYVEARQDEYLDAQREYARSIPRAFKIGAQGKQLDRLFQSSSIQHVTWVTGEVVVECYHVPVSSKLRNAAEKLGQLLHAQMKLRVEDDPWWGATRDWLKDIYRNAWTCARGNLLSPLFLENGKTVGKFTVEVSDQYKLQELMRPGTKGVLRVEYLKSAPRSWMCDLG